MLILISTYQLHATLGEQRFQLRVPQTDLEAVLRVLIFNRASAVGYVLENPEHPEVMVTPQWPSKPA
jgi:hypothetical protein